jgi:hypothetical protein
VSGAGDEHSFVANGLAGPAIACEARTLHVTIDFEAFAPSMIDGWSIAMERWASVAGRRGLACTFFVSIEDAIRLRSEEPAAYRVLLSGLIRLHHAGSTIQPHNHRVFDPRTGRQRTPAGVPKSVAGYAKQASMFYDVVHRHGMAFGDWFPTVLSSYRTLLQDAEIPEPAQIVFRPGGWDCGATADEQRGYLEALAGAGVMLHSGDSRGTYGTSSYRVGSRFGENVYRLHSGIVEVAPCWALNCGAPTLSLRSAATLQRLLVQPVARDRDLGGAFVAVLHFDHLFHSGWRASLREFAVRSPEAICARVDRSLRRLDGVRRRLRLTPLPLEDVRPAAALPGALEARGNDLRVPDHGQLSRTFADQSAESHN